jgi:hypothetical protein
LLVDTYNGGGGGEEAIVLFHPISINELRSAVPEECRSAKSVEVHGHLFVKMFKWSTPIKSR